MFEGERASGVYKSKKLDGYLNALPGYINKVLNGVSTYEKS